MGTVMSGEAQPLVSDSGVRVHSPSAARAAGTTVCLILAGVLGLLFLVGALQCSFVVEPGTVGVVATLGHVHTYEPGLHFRAPYVSNVVHMSVKTQLLEQANVIPTKEGLSVELDTAMREFYSRWMVGVEVAVEDVPFVGYRGTYCSFFLCAAWSFATCE
mmetsp:Transcript_20892/g.60820  ORF Transcript_20892/g.60820 Transcript_20892/m.60820 type:complete len:160 (+) Transcript_20892:309-788(+)